MMHVATSLLAVATGLLLYDPVAAALAVSWAATATATVLCAEHSWHWLLGLIVAAWLASTAVYIWRTRTVWLPAALLAGVLALRWAAPLHMDDVHPSLPLPLQHGASVYWVIPLRGGVPIGSDPSFCRRLMGTGARIGMHGVDHESCAEFESTEGIDPRRLTDGIEAMDTAFGAEWSRTFKPPCMRLSSASRARVLCATVLLADSRQARATGGRPAWLGYRVVPWVPACQDGALRALGCECVTWFTTTTCRGELAVGARKPGRRLEDDAGAASCCLGPCGYAHAEPAAAECSKVDRPVCLPNLTTLLGSFF